MKKQLPILAAAGFIALALAGCTSTGAGDSATPSAGASAEAATEAATEYVAPDVDGACIDGTATIAESNSLVTIEGDCENVVITSSSSLVTITGSVTNLSIGGSINHVKVPAVANVTFDGDGHTLFTPSTPAVTDNGAENAVVAE